MKNVWFKSGNNYMIREISQQVKEIPASVYKLQIDAYGNFFLSEIQESFKFPYKIYGMENDFISRVKKSWENTDGNMGILLNGTKGTGKTVTAELICNSMKLPVILINFQNDGIVSFLNDLQQDCIVFIDEFEKIYASGKSTSLLSIMDGALRTDCRKMFILTTNELNIDPNLLQRPSRIRYVKTFGDMDIDTIVEVVKDKLAHPHLFDVTVKFISEMPIITLDLVKSVIEEVNIHSESPYNFKSIFNIHSDQFNLKNLYAVVNGKKVVIAECVNMYPSFFTSYSIGQYLSSDSHRYGMIENVVSDNEIVISTFPYRLLQNREIEIPVEEGDMFDDVDDGDWRARVFKDKMEFDKTDGDGDDIYVIPSQKITVTIEPALRVHKSFSRYYTPSPL